MKPPSQLRAARGMSLIELMVAVTLGLLLVAGIVALFLGAATTSRVQEGLARLQENGRFLVTRLNTDLGMAAGQYCATQTAASRGAANGIQPNLLAMELRVPNFRFPDWGGAPLSRTDPVMLSPRFLIQGHDCVAGGNCAPAQPALPSLPAAGTAVGNRVPGTDVLTVRYLRGDGWRVAACSGGGAAISLSGDGGPGDTRFDPPLNASTWAAGDIALMSDCFSPPKVFNASLGGSVLSATPSDLTCPDARSINSGDVRVFNFSRDFISVTYYLRLRADENPDRAGRLIAVLVRRETGANGQPLEQELAQGVERLDFLYVVDDAAGATRYLSAAEVNTITACPAGAPALEVPAAEGACGWRSVKAIEVHLLLNTVDDNFGINPTDTVYRYSVDGADFQPAPAVNGVMPVTGLRAGHMQRREFVSLVALRNYNL